MRANGFKTEWCVLQSQFDNYEKHSLYIKLLSVIVLTGSVLSGSPGVLVLLLLSTLWLQDAIWKTFQSRMESRLLQIEKHISQASEADAFQFNSEYQNSRSSGLSLINEYFRQSIRPTVAFPHIVLILICVVHIFTRV